MDYRKIRSAEDLIKLGYGESLPLEAKPSPDRSDASNISNMLSEAMVGPIYFLKTSILYGSIEEIRENFNKFLTAWHSAMDSVHTVSRGTSYEYPADQAEYMLEHNDDMRIQASLKRRRKANPHTFDEDFYEPIDRDEADRIKGTNEYMNSIGVGVS